MSVYFYEDRFANDLSLKFYTNELIINTNYERTALIDTSTFKGYENSCLTLQAINENDANLLIDNNGDGHAENIIHTTWEALL